MRTKRALLLGMLLLGMPALIYVASYVAVVHRYYKVSLTGQWKEGERYPLEADYRCGGHYAEKLYSPLLRCDRRLRPNYWYYTFHTNRIF